MSFQGIASTAGRPHDEFMCFLCHEATKIQLMKDVEEGRSGDLLAVTDLLQLAGRADNKGDGIIIGQAAQEAEEFNREIPVQSDGFKLVQQQDQFQASSAQSGYQITYILIGGSTLGDRRIMAG